jgi:hypothetical protein
MPQPCGGVFLVLRDTEMQVEIGSGLFPSPIRLGPQFQTFGFVFYFSTILTEKGIAFSFLQEYNQMSIAS